MEGSQIVVADGDATRREATARSLRRAGCAVAEAGTGEEVLRLTRARRPDLLLLEGDLPDGGGMRLARRLKADPATASLLLLYLAGTGDPEDPGTTVDGYLVRPVEERELLAAVRSLLRLRQAEESRQHYHLLVERARDIILFIRPDGRLLEANAAAVEAYGYPREELLSLRIQDLRAGPVEHDLPEQLRAATESGLTFEAVHRRRDGSTFPVEVSARGADLAGERVVLSLLRDITERRAVEEALRKREAVLAQAGQMAHLGAWDIELAEPEDVNANPLTWSDEVYRIFGYEPGEVQASNELFFARVPPEDRGRIAAAVAAALAHRRPYTIEHRVTRPDGVERVVQEHAEVTFDARGRPLRIVGAVQDITERRLVEREQKRLQARLLATERARAEIAERMTAEINHRMKNNLTLLSGVLEMQAMHYPEGSPLAAALRDAITRLTALSAVHEQLYEAGSARVELRDVLRRVAEMDVQTLAASDVALTVRGDITYISAKLASTLALLANELVTNALRFGGRGRQGRREVEVSLARDLEGLHLRVANSGNPVPAGFDPTHQHGLGLPLVESVVTRQLHGTLTIHPDGAGTVAEILVPADIASAADFVPDGNGDATQALHEARYE